MPGGWTQMCSATEGEPRSADGHRHRESDASGLPRVAARSPARRLTRSSHLPPPSPSASPAHACDASLVRLQLRMGWPGVATWVSARVSAALRSTVLGPAIEFAVSAGDVVTARCASEPGAIGEVLMAVRGALVVDGPHGLLDRTTSLSPRPTNRDSRGNDDGPGGRQERPEDRRGHEGQPVTQTTKQFMRQLLYSSPSRGNRVGPADAEIIRAHHGKTDGEANPTDSPFRWYVLVEGLRRTHGR